MTKLGLARPKLPKRLGNRHALHPTLEQLIELRTARRDALDVLAPLKDGHACLKALALDLLCDLVALIRLGLSYALDVQHLLLGATTMTKDSEMVKKCRLV